jgi:hypothetical protein
MFDTVRLHLRNPLLHVATMALMGLTMPAAHAIHARRPIFEGCGAICWADQGFQRCPYRAAG